ncbi:MAG: hypothetical protein H7X93_02660, partial [Sphingomonadaceae bacterium]|nr:hypothetical protein [Sphingomonadaceae bacterium]
MEASRRIGGAGPEFFPGERAVRAHPLIDLVANAWLLGIVPWIVYCSVEGFANGWWTLLSYYVRPLAWPPCAAFALPLALWAQFVGLGTRR